MKNKLLKAAKNLIPILFWIAVWEIFAIAVNHRFFLPTVGQTLEASWVILSSKSFFTVVASSILRVILGIAIGTALAVLLAASAYRFEPVKLLLSPLMSIIKTTPIATFIILLWIMLSGNTLTVFICVLMILPIVWQNLLDGYASIDKNLNEVCAIYNFSYLKRLKVLIFPALIRYFIPAFITSTGLAWKAVISAEIIAYVSNSIGQLINDAKYNFDSPSVFAWTLIVIIFSLLFERLTKFLLSRYEK